MRNGQDGDDAVAVLVRGHEDDGAGTVLDPFLLSAHVLMLPQVAVADHEARNRFRERHTAIPVQGRRPWRTRARGSLPRRRCLHP